MSSSINASQDEFDAMPLEGAVAYIADCDGTLVDDLDSGGVDPKTATEAKPGSEDKVVMLAARYAAGLPLWHDSDCYDHAPDLIGDEDAEDEALTLDFLDEEEEGDA